MKILLVGRYETWAIERSFEKALRDQGATVEVFEWWREGAPGGRTELIRRPIWPLVARRANRALAKAGRGDHDVVFVIKGLLLDRETLEGLRRPGRPVVCFNADNPWNRAPSSYSPVTEAAFPAWDAYLIWSQFLVSRLYSSGCRRAEVLPFAWDPHSFPHRTVKPGDETCEITFAGNWSAHRERWIRRLSDLPITLYGKAWQRVVASLGETALIAKPKIPYTREYAAEVAGAKVALNILDPHNCPGTNMRSFEIPGAGGVMCSTWTEDVEAFFPDGAVRTFRTEQDLREQLDELLGDPAARDDVRRRSHAVAEENTYSSRASTLLSLFEELRTSAGG